MNSYNTIIKINNFFYTLWQISKSRHKITEGGRVVIPAEYRRALNLEVGDEVVCILDDGEIRIIPRQEALRRAQDIIGKYAKSRSLADELISQRREETRYEYLCTGC